MAVPPPSKAELRAEALGKRAIYSNSLDLEARSELEVALAILALPRLAAATVIGLYHPLKAEIGTAPLAARLAGRPVAFPWFAHRDALMMFRAGPAIAPGPWGVLQPAPEALALAPDAVIVPLVLADIRGTRIGHGKGHYDRALANLRAAHGPVLTIGLGWDWQVVEEPIAPDPWDVPLDALVTPERWIDCR